MYGKSFSISVRFYSFGRLRIRYSHREMSPQINKNKSARDDSLNE